MKAIKKALALSLMIIIAFGCSNSDDSNGSDSVSQDNLAKIIGLWKFTSSTTNGVIDVIDDPCELLFNLDFTANQVSIQEYSGEGCSTQQSTSDSYSISGNTLNIGGFVVEITTLNNTTLKVQYTEGTDTITETYTKQ
ncbi:lipocalin family protein [Olleya sp. AH-315-F22]|nr:lipocalin family protein [Olleya sp. AH-315-F22]